MQALRVDFAPSSPRIPYRRAGWQVKTLAFRKGSGLGRPYLVLLHTADPPDPLEWNQYLEAVSSILGESFSCVHVFIATDGGGPDAAQRKALANVIQLGPADALSHIFTTSTFVRGIVTAFRWVAGARAIAHLPEELAKVCEESGYRAADVLHDIALAQESFPIVRTVRLVQGSVPDAKAR